DKEILKSKGNATFQQTVTKNGQEKHLIIYRSYISNLEIEETGIIGVLLDITNQIKTEIAEKKLKETETFFKTITENMHDLISLTDASGIFQYVSPAHIRYLNFEPNYMVGKSIFDFLHPDDLSRVKPILAEMISKKMPGKAEFRYRKDDGSYIWLESTGKFIFNNDNEIESIIFVSRDIKEQKKSQNNLKFLSNSALTFLSLTLNDDIFDFIGKQLYHFLPNCLIFANDYNNNTKQLIVKNFQGVSTILEKILSVLGKHPVGMKLRAGDPTLDLKNGRLNKIKLKDFRNHIENTPAFLFDQVCKLLNIEDVFNIGLAVDNKFYGNISIIPLNGSIL
ncbi:MAG: PAS domain S-box protein, partial [Bacteroidales bacterium]|nr:PAS domain S-box protein [Bacteroidales bacterium]